MLMQSFGVKKKEHYDMLWYFLEWSIAMGPGDSHQKGLNFCYAMLIFPLCLLLFPNVPAIILKMD